MAKRKRRKLRKGVVLFLLLLIAAGVGTALILFGKFSPEETVDKVKEKLPVEVKNTTCS